MNDTNHPINEAIQHLRKIINQNSAEKASIYERLYNLYLIIQYPNRTLPDGTTLSATPIKNDKSTKNHSADGDPLSSNPLNSSLNTEFSRRNANELERKRVNNRLNGFSLKDSIAWQEICKRYGPNLNQSELLSMAEIIGQEAGIKVDREAKRRKEVLIKWYEENLEVVLKMLPYFKLVDSNGNALRGDDQEDDNDDNSDENSEENNEGYTDNNNEQNNQRYINEAEDGNNEIKNENNKEADQL